MLKMMVSPQVSGTSTDLAQSPVLPTIPLQDLHPTMLEAVETLAIVSMVMESVLSQEPFVSAGPNPVSDADLEAALRLVPQARAQLDAAEAGVIAFARKRGLTWNRIGGLTGDGDWLAAHQHFTQLSNRLAAVFDAGLAALGDREPPALD